TQTDSERIGKYPVPIAAERADMQSETANAQPFLSVPAWLLLGWLGGVGVMAGITLLALYSLRQTLRRALPLADPALLALALEAAAAMGLGKSPRILVTPTGAGAMTLGAWRPTVLLSQQTLEHCSPPELRLVLAHEFAHLQRGDSWLGLLPHLAQ